MEPPAIGTTEIPGRGRAMISLRPLKAGEIILRESPIILYSALPFHPTNNHQTNTYCSHCFTIISPHSQPITCSTCSSQFCTITCQSKASTSSHTPWVCQTQTRLIKLVSNNSDSLDIQTQTRSIVSAYNLAVLSPMKFQTLLSLHGSGSYSDNLFDSSASFIHSLVSSVCPPLPVDVGFSLELTKALLMKDKLNSFGLMEPFSEKNGQRSLRAGGVYPVASLFNHDCLPNACRFDYLDAVDGRKPDDNTEITIRMIHDVPQAREICLSYFPVNLKYVERQKRLSEDYGFVCDCDRCKVEAGWSESEEEGLAMDDGDDDDVNEEGNDGSEEGAMDEDVDERMEGEDDFPHTYFFLNYMCDRTNCGGTLAPLPPSGAETSGVMECNVCGNLKSVDVDQV
ncbi:histone-lysine N-methyltransferase ASHR2-like [Bidens hawaiensis]|uniref:histone-lysine N-methyltransferase ASHR2-like n=1 Tax=Bidens hawaiensis TaxID=980011 RepID=UPI00404A5530